MKVFKARANGELQWGLARLNCALGENGVIASDAKREGDKCSPLGDWPMRRVLYRPDRLDPPKSGLPVIPLKPHDGWCDDPNAGFLYNQPVSLPCTHSHELLWREDHVYDVIVPLGYNDDPVIAGRGSAIFMHVARGDYAPTEGCVALNLRDLLDLLTYAEPGDVVRITE